MLADHESNIWVGTEADGLMRLSADGPAAMNDPSFPSLRSVTALFEDREKNLWIGTSQGIERLRDNTFMTYSAGEGLTAPANGPLFVDAENRTWFAPSTGGLSWLKDDKVENIAGLANDIVYSITGDKNDIWIGRQRGGLTRIHFEGGERSMTTYTQKDGLAQNSVFTVHRGADGSIWAGTLSGGVSKFKNGVFTNYTTADGLASDTITDIAESADGTMWFATPDGLTSLSGTQWKTYSTGDGLAGSRVECMLSGPENILWLGTNKGLAFIRDGSVVSLPDIPLLKKQPVFGLADDNHGSLWITTAANVLRLDREKLLAGTLTIEDIREFGTADGLASVEGVKRSKSVIADENGRVWLSLNRGISVADINRMKTVSVPAIVRINSIAADGNPVDIGSVPQIMSNVQRIAIGFAGLSLAAPERVRYRYMLEGFDPGFSDPTSVPEAVYTNLNPGTYRFHVIASNSEGAWNSAESSMELTIKPMLWQTWWFRMIAIVTLMLAGVGVYRLRLARLTKRLNSRFEERLAERTRIAQELHDSLLQGFVGASMQLDVAIDNLNDAKAKPALTHILGLMNKVTDEGRNTVRGLRASSRSDLSNLPDAFTRIWQDMPLNRAVDFRVIVDGTPRPLHAVVHDDIFRIGGEALINAFRHSEGSIIRVFIEYGAKKFILRVTDNGRGMEAQILQHGRDGHWGLSGMRERADRIGARLKLLSRVGNGTEVQLNVPASVAYERNSSDGLAKIWIMKLFGQAGQTEIGKSNDQ
jgi:signal transduction histidine kinase